MITLRVEGGEKLAKELRGLSNRVNRSVQRQALLDAAQPMRDMARQAAPRAPGAPDLAENIEFGNTTADSGDVAIALGPTKRFFYGSFQEFGTSRHGAQPFMRPAFDSTVQQVIKRFTAEVWSALVRRGAGSGRGSGGGVGL